MPGAGAQAATAAERGDECSCPSCRLLAQAQASDQRHGASCLLLTGGGRNERHNNLKTAGVMSATHHVCRTSLCRLAATHSITTSKQEVGTCLQYKNEECFLSYLYSPSVNLLWGILPTGCRIDVQSCKEEALKYGYEVLKRKIIK